MGCIVMTKLRYLESLELYVEFDEQGEKYVLHILRFLSIISKLGIQILV